MTRIEREVRGIPLWQILEYLEALGGRAVGEHAARTDDWNATLEQIEDFQIGSLKVGQVLLVVEGDEGVLAELNLKLDEKLLRAGG